MTNDILERRRTCLIKDTSEIREGSRWEIEDPFSHQLIHVLLLVAVIPASSPKIDNSSVLLN